MSKRRKRKSAVVVALLLAAEMVAINGTAIASSAEDSGLPLAQLQSLARPPANSPEPRGNPLLLQFWASWCHSCSSIMFDLDELLQQYPGTDYLGVSLDGERSDALQYIEKHALYEKFSDRFFIDSDKFLSTALGVETVPTVILFDAQGKEVVRRSGHLNGTDLQRISAGIKSVQQNRQGED